MTEKSSPQPAPLSATVATALRRAFNLGQTYWQQADSDSYSQNAKSDITRGKFDALVEETTAAVAAVQAPEGGELPPLPPVTWPRNVGVPSWTAEEVQAYARAAIRAAQRQAERDNASFERGYQHGRQQERQLQEARAQAPAEGDELLPEPVAYWFRNIVDGEPASEWRPVELRNPYMDTIPGRVKELRGHTYKGKPCYEVMGVYTEDQMRAALASKVQPKGTPAGENWHAHHVAVNKAALRMVRNALRTDAEAGKTVRAEMLDELDKATFTIPSPAVAQGSLTKTEFARLWREHMGAPRFSDEAWEAKQITERAHGIGVSHVPVQGQ